MCTKNFSGSIYSSYVLLYHMICVSTAADIQNIFSKIKV